MRCNHSICVYGRPEHQQQDMKHLIVFFRHAFVLGVTDFAHTPAGEKPPCQKAIHQKAVHQDRKNHFLHSSFHQNMDVMSARQLPGPTCQLWACHNCSVSNLILPVENERLLGNSLRVCMCKCVVCVWCTHMQAFTAYVHTSSLSVHQKCFQGRKKGVFAWNPHLRVFATF